MLREMVCSPSSEGSESCLGLFFFYFPIFPPLNKFIHFPNWANDCVHFGLAVLFHFINLALLTTVTAEKTSFRAKKEKG